MSINLTKNELALADPDFRNDLIDNFTKIEKEINRIDLETESAVVMQFKQNIEDIVTMLNKYDFPIAYRDGKIIDLEEEN